MTPQELITKLQEAIDDWHTDHIARSIPDYTQWGNIVDVELSENEEWKPTGILLICETS